MLGFGVRSPQVQGLVSHKRPRPLQSCQSRIISAVLLTGYKLWFLLSLLGFDDLLEQLTEVREAHLPVYYIIKEMIKDMDEQPDKDTHRARS